MSDSFFTKHYIALAKMINNLEITDEFINLLSEEIIYESQWVFTSLEGKTKYLEYLRGKNKTIKDSNFTVYAELGKIHAWRSKQCVIIAQGAKDDLQGLMFLDIKEDLITRIDMCAVPRPESAKRTGIYPK